MIALSAHPGLFFALEEHFEVFEVYRLKLISFPSLDCVPTLDGPSGLMYCR